MAAKVTISASTGSGKTLEQLAAAIEQRAKHLEETTSEAVIATAINILSSLRARTKVASVKRICGVEVFKSSYVVGWFRQGGKNRRCIRACQNGARLPCRFVSLANRKDKNEDLGVWHVKDLKDANDDAVKREYYIIARAEGDAKKFAETKRVKRIKRYRGLAKTTIGLIQSHISQRDVNGGQMFDNGGTLRSIAQAVSSVYINQSGYNSGTCSVSVSDSLRYAVNALKGGPADLEMAMQKAANRTVGIINHHWKRQVFDYPPLPTPFPEVAGRRR